MMMMMMMVVMVMIVMMVMVMLHDGAPGHVVACRIARAAGSSKKPPQSRSYCHNFHNQSTLCNDK